MNKKHQEEAEAIGFTLISEKPLVKNGIEDFNYKVYKCNICATENYLQPTHVRRNSVTCQTCYTASLVSDAEQHGFTLVERCSDPEFCIVKRDKCGHIFKMRTQGVKRRIRKGSNPDHDCEQCYNARLKLDAENKNLTYLGPALTKKGVFRNYRFNLCGHTRDINATCVARGNFFCSECKEVRYSNEAQNAGLIYKGFGTVPSECKRLYELPCGHTKEIRMDHARDGSYLCDTCGDSHYTKPSKIYLLKIKSPDSFTWLKLGFAKNLAIRKNNYGLIKGCEVEILALIDVPTGALAVSKEKSWHKIFKPFRLDPKLMKKYQKFNGFTECYSVEIEQSILQVVSDLQKELNGQ